MTPRVQIVCGEPLPFGGFPATGAGLRAWSLGEGLKTHGFEVVYSLPVDVVDRFPSPSPGLRSAAFEYHRLDDAIRRVNPSVVVTQGWIWANMMTARGDMPLAVDLTGPYVVESLFSRATDLQTLPFRKLAALEKADFVTCAGEVQRHYFLSWLLLGGHDIQTEACPAVPMSLSPSPPEPEPPEEPVFVYSGLFLPWQDPTPALRRVIQKLDERGRGRLLIFGGAHPTYAFPTGATPAFIESLKSHPRVEFAGMTPYETMTERMTRCSVSVDLMPRNAERELAFTTRTVVAMWCGLPVLYNDYAELSGYIRDYQAGWTVDPDDARGMDAALNMAFDDPETVRRYGMNARRVVKEKLNWEKTVAPLAAFCRSPYKRPRHPSVLEQTITPLDDRLCRWFVTFKRSSFYRGLKKFR